MEPIGSGTNRAAQLTDTLRKLIAYLAPGLHNRGGPIIVLPSNQNASLFQPLEISATLQYLSSLPEPELRSSGYLVIIDNREQFWRQLKPVYALVQQTVGANVYLVAVLQRDDQLFEKAKKQLIRTASKKRIEFGFEVLKINLVKLLQYVSRGALPAELGGAAPYNHEAWIQTRIKVEGFLDVVGAITDGINQAEMEARAGTLNVRSARFNETALARPGGTLDRGRALLTALRTERAAQFSVPDAVDQVRMCSLIAAACEALERRISTVRQRLDATLPSSASFVSNVSRGNSQSQSQLQLQSQHQPQSQYQRPATGYGAATLERFGVSGSANVSQLDVSRANVDELLVAARSVIDAVRREEPVALLTLPDGISLIGQSARAADDSRRAFDAAELRFTDSFAKFSSLRTIANTLGNPQQSVNVLPQQISAVRALVEQLEVTVRRVAKRLDSRRALHDQAARFYRAATEAQRKLDSVLELICADSLRDESVARARELLEAFEAATREGDAAVQSANSICTTLLNQLQTELNSLPSDSMEANATRNALLGDQQNVRGIIESLNERHKRAAELGEVRRLKLEQLNQLRTCEEELEKALRCVAELRRTATLKRGESGRTAFDTERVRAAHTELEKGSLGAFRLARQLVQTAFSLRQALRLDNTKCEQHAETLNILWKDLAFAIEDESNRIDLTMEFNQNADNILQRIEALLIRLARAEESQQTDVFTRFLAQHKGECDWANERFSELQEQAGELIPAAQSATPNQVDPPAAQSIRMKMNTIDYKLRELNAFWSGTLPRSGAARRGRSAPPRTGLRPIVRSDSLQSSDRELINSQFDQISRTSSQFSAAPRDQRFAAEAGDVHFTTGHVTTITQVTRQVLEEQASQAQNASATFAQSQETQRTSELESLFAQLRDDHNWVRLRVQQMEPDLFRIGDNLEEAIELRREHAELCSKMSAKQAQTQELLARADHLVSQNANYSQAYGSTAESLAQSWRDFNGQLELRRQLLEQSVAFYTREREFSGRLEEALNRCAANTPFDDAESVRRVLGEHHELRQSVMDAARVTLENGQTLLERVRSRSVGGATRADSDGLERTLEALRARRSQFDELWQVRRSRLEVLLALCQLDAEANRLSRWFDEVGDPLLRSAALGDNLAHAQQLQNTHQQFDQVAKQVRADAARLVRAADQLLYSGAAPADVETVRSRLRNLDERAENFASCLTERRTLQLLAINFFKDAQVATQRLDAVANELRDLGQVSSSVQLNAERYAQLARAVEEAAVPAVRAGHIVLERAAGSTSVSDTAGIRNTLNELEKRAGALDGLASNKRAELGQLDAALGVLERRLTAYFAWLSQVCERALTASTDVGATVEDAQYFVSTHERLRSDLQTKSAELAAFERDCAAVPHSEKQTRALRTLIEQWDRVHVIVDRRCRFASAHLELLRLAFRIDAQLESLDEYVTSTRADIRLVANFSDPALADLDARVEACGREHVQLERLAGELRRALAVQIELDRSGAQSTPDGAAVNLRLDNRRAIEIHDSIMQRASQKLAKVRDSSAVLRKLVLEQRDWRTQWDRFVDEARRTIDKSVRVEQELLPAIVVELGSSQQDATNSRRKLRDLVPALQQVHGEIERLVGVGETLGSRGDTHGQKEQIVGELAKCAQRFGSRIADYDALLRTIVNFLATLQELDSLIERCNSESRAAFSLVDVNRLQQLLSALDSSREHAETLLRRATDDAGQIANRLQQSNADRAAVEYVLRMADERRELWTRAVIEQRERIEAALRLAQCADDLRGLDGELDALEMARAASKSQLSAANEQALRRAADSLPELDAQIGAWSGRLRSFTAQCDAAIRGATHADAAQVGALQSQLAALERKWSRFAEALAEYRTSVAAAGECLSNVGQLTRFNTVTASLLIDVGRRLPQCTSATECEHLASQLRAALSEAESLDPIANRLPEQAVTLFGPMADTRLTRPTISKFHETREALKRALFDVQLAGENAASREETGRRQAQEELVARRTTVTGVYAMASNTVELLAARDASASLSVPPPKRLEAQLPVVTQPLKSVEVMEGARVVLECLFASESPVRQVEWFKANLPITTPDYVTRAGPDFATLTIQETFGDDTGVYKVRISNEAGAVESAAQLTVRETHQQLEPPEFARPLRDLDVVDGAPVAFECLVSGRPTPRVSWYRNDECIDGAPQYVITQVGGVCCLKLRAAKREEHDARFTCRAQNTAGEAVTSARLGVLTPEPPVFVDALPASLRVMENEAANLQCRFRAAPPAQVVWSRNGQVLLQSGVYQIATDAQSTRLLVPQTVLEDAGEYTVTLRNAFGETTNSCSLTVDPLPASRRQGVTPVFTEPLRDAIGREGDRVRLECRFAGNPLPTLRWHINGREVRDSSRVRGVVDGDRAALLLDDLRPADAGAVVCVAQNAAGQARCSCSLRVELASSDEEQPVTRSKSPKIPIMVDPLRDAQGVEGEPILLMCRARSALPAEAVWSKDGNPLPFASDLVASVDGDVYSLSIGQLFEDDAGTYVCEVRNSAGSARTSCSLVVHPPRSFAPEFVRTFRDARIRVTDQVVFECELIGEPQPNIAWSFNGAPLAASNDCQIEAVGAVHRLTLHNASQRQAGRYAIAAENPSGKAVCTAMLTVTDEQASPAKIARFGADASAEPNLLVSATLVDSERTLSKTQSSRLKWDKPFEHAVEAAGPSAGSETYTAQLEAQVEARFKPVDLTIVLPIPPRFVEPLRNVVVSEGASVELSGLVDLGDRPQPPAIRWSKDGRTIREGSADFELRFDNGRVSLSIPEAFEPDAGAYTCRVQTESGAAESSAQLTVRVRSEPPTFTERFGAQRVREGEPVRFVVRVGGQPPPTVTWYRDGQAIVSSPDFVIEQQNDVHSLHIPETFAEDAGRYSAKAQNTAGEAICAAELVIDAEEEQSPPVFTRPLQNVTVFDGQPIALECALRANPPVTQVLWHCGSEELKNSPDWTISFVDGVCRLLINEAFVDDQGTYTCTAINALGQRATSAFVCVNEPPDEPPTQQASVAPTQKPRAASTSESDVEPDAFEIRAFESRLRRRAKVEKKVPPPVIVDRLVDTQGHQSEPLELRCSVRSARSASPCRLRWYHNGKRIRASSAHSLTVEPLPSTATDLLLDCRAGVQKLDTADAGWYTVCAVNPGGRDVSSAQVAVEAVIGGIDSSSFVAPNTLSQLERLRAEPAREQTESGIIEKHLRPSFKTTPSDMQVQETQPVRFDCTVNGRPIPGLTWFRDSDRVYEDERHKIVVNEDGIHSLIIQSAFVADAGNYTCVASNRAGEARFTVQLKVVPKAVPKEPLSPPSFLERAENRTVKEGELVVFRCRIRGVPPPTITWQKDAKPVPIDSGRYHVDIQVQPGVPATAVLTIDAAQAGDTGWFQCIAANPGGTASCRAKLSVQPNPDASRNAKPPRKLDVDEAIRQAKDEAEKARLRAVAERMDKDAAYDPNKPRPPKFLRPLPDRVELKDNQPLHLESRLMPTGDPSMQVEWLKNGQVIMPATRCKITQEFAYVALDVLYSYGTDSGTYECRARNAFGADSTNKCEVFAAGKSPLVEALPPTFLQKPESVEITEGEAAKFVVKVGGQPEPRVSWFLKNSVLLNSTRVRIVDDGPVHWLELASCTVQDAGEVKAVASSNVGETNAACHLRVTPIAAANDEADSAPAQQKPVFTQRLEQLEAQEGDSALLSVAFTGVPLPSVSWFRNKVEIQPSDDFRITTDYSAKTSSLYIPHLFVQDSGLYSAKAVNPLGSANTKAKLNVLPAGEPPTPPVFDLPLNDQAVMQYEPLRLDCSVVSQPSAAVQWYKDGVPISDGPRWKVIADGLRHTLLVYEAQPEDAGSYECRAENVAGQAVSGAQVLIEERAAAHELAPSEQPAGTELEFAPSVLQPLADVSVREGQRAVLECRIDAYPEATPIWFFEHSQIKQSRYFSMLSRPNGVETLTIAEAFPEDAGTYRLVAQNAIGRCETSCALHVMPDDAPPPLPKDYERVEPPRVVQPLTDMTVQELEPVRLEAVITCPPASQIVWFVNDSVIESSPDFLINREGDKCSLTIREAFPEDAGTYAVHVRSLAGEARTAAQLHVQGTHPDSLAHFDGDEVLDEFER